MIRFHYQNEESDLGPVKRPVADAKLKNGDIVIEIAMYIDSGADISMIPYHFGKALGLYQEPDDEIHNIKGIEGSGVPYIIKELELAMGLNFHTIRVAWAQTEEVPILMGRMDIFNRYRITFNEKESWIDFIDL